MRWLRRGGAGVLLAALVVGALPGQATPATREPRPTTRSPVSTATGHAISGHEDAEGLKLVADTDETVRHGSRCPSGMPLRRFEVAAIPVDITLNRWGDHDPLGRMFALADAIPTIRAEERRNAAARRGAGDPAVSNGLQGDAIQPLTLRARPGECVRVSLRNDLDQDVSLHIHGAAVVLANGRPASAPEPGAGATPHRSVTYEWAIPRREPEGTHYFHAEGEDERSLVGHGLFGTLIVEPPGSTWLDPRDPSRLATGWDAMIRDPDGPDFRELTLVYHEIGDETYQLTDHTGKDIPLVDPITNSYRPAGRALNYRSEPFLDRLALGQSVMGRADESLEYSSYAFGDPATPMPRTYLGDPVKQRVVHGGSEVFHVHHLHGGAVRWRRQLGAEPSSFASGRDKHPKATPTKSERTDSQTIGPSETFDVADECGAGGCQGSVGDFLYHCHVAHHYFSGMWGIWRVYNTLQNGDASTDSLPPLAPLPDRADRVKPGVTSDELQLPDGQALANVVERQLPPQGTRAADEATRFDWVRTGDRYLGEPETTAVWANYRSTTPGERPALRFDPATGRLAFPFLRPHLAVRPPFAPGHGPAPYLDPVLKDGVDPPEPGSNGAGSVCPSGTTPVSMPINAISQTVTLNEKQRIVDPKGQLYVRREQLDAVRRDPSLQVPLVLRTRAGRDCIDVLLRSELTDTAETPYSKVGLHIHFVQFDVQASDGLDTGFNYEQTVRPFREEGTVLRATTRAGATTLSVENASRYSAGVVIGVGLDRDAEVETAIVVSNSDGRLTIDRPLQHDHVPGEIVGTEFVRYRWYPDVQFGTAYFHDHVNALSTWTHGLFGALVAEPADATWTDPHTGTPLVSGAVADVHTKKRSGIDVTGSFRELVLLTQDDQPLTHVGRATGSSFNLRAEPLDGRPGPSSLQFSSAHHGDPGTPLLEANLGDPVVIRSLVGAANEIHTTQIVGHSFRVEPWSETSPEVSTVRVGISERFDLVIARAGGPQQQPGDYLYFNGRPSKLREGSWGLVRVDGPGEGSLTALPGHERVPSPSRQLCPSSAPVRQFDVAAVDLPLPMLDGSAGKAYVLERDLAATKAGKRPPEPLVLHISVGDCLRVRLRNTTAGRVTYFCDVLASDPSSSGGPAAGREPDQSIPTGGTRTYEFYATPTIGETVGTARDWGDVLGNGPLGLYGAVVVGPRDAHFRDPVTGGDLSGRSSWRADVVLPDGTSYRDFTLLFEDTDDGIGTHRMPYTRQVRGTSGVNYQRTPGAPALDAYAGDPVRLHVVAPWSEQAQVFSLDGHRWPQEFGLRGSPLKSSQAIAGGEAQTFRLDGGAGGKQRIAGTYLWEDHRLPFSDAGLKGTFVVRPRHGRAIGVGRLRRLPGTGDEDDGPSPWTLGVAGAVLAAVAVVILTRRRARLRS
jgi:FtsP/CotA-like multicopper oxidase with cupredoxin domain